MRKTFTIQKFNPFSVHTNIGQSKLTGSAWAPCRRPPPRPRTFASSPWRGRGRRTLPRLLPLLRPPPPVAGVPPGSPCACPKPCCACRVKREKEKEIKHAREKVFSPSSFGYRSTTRTCVSGIACNESMWEEGVTRRKGHRRHFLFQAPSRGWWERERKKGPCCSK